MGFLTVASVVALAVVMLVMGSDRASHKLTPMSEMSPDYEDMLTRSAADASLQWRVVGAAESFYRMTGPILYQDENGVVVSEAFMTIAATHRYGKIRWEKPQDLVHTVDKTWAVADSSKELGYREDLSHDEKLWAAAVEHDDYKDHPSFTTKRSVLLHDGNTFGDIVGNVVAERDYPLTGLADGHLFLSTTESLVMGSHQSNGP